MTDESGKGIEHFSNMNLMTQKDIKKDGNLFKINSFHKLESKSPLIEKLKDKKLKELKIPLNDILTLRKGNEEIHLEFILANVFL
jgi:hypothetical protein